MLKFWLDKSNFEINSSSTCKKLKHVILWFLDWCLDIYSRLPRHWYISLGRNNVIVLFDIENPTKKKLSDKDATLSDILPYTAQKLFWLLFLGKSTVISKQIYLL